ncbi:KxYKxGKxW signal peptide domain-containing protein [Fructilactobacillus florum]|uniref:KxYKxGKxW signal peptide domain-containing protein n=1 Tax=Fructilactobacillus florum TaxID=640331 RepID=UPI0034E24EC0
MYKAKGKWVYAGITTMVVTGGFLFLNQAPKSMPIKQTKQLPPSKISLIVAR